MGFHCANGLVVMGICAQLCTLEGILLLQTKLLEKLYVNKYLEPSLLCLLAEMCGP